MVHLGILHGGSLLNRIYFLVAEIAFQIREVTAVKKMMKKEQEMEIVMTAAIRTHSEGNVAGNSIGKIIHFSSF
jgi:hypothetical protein